MTRRIQPLVSSYSLTLGNSVFLSALHINCESLAGALTLLSNNDLSVILEDNGQNGDVAPGDGIVSLKWTPQASGTYRLRFSGDDVMEVVVRPIQQEIPEGSPHF